MPKNYCIMQIWAESGKSALPICNYSQILYQFLTFTQNLKRSPHDGRHTFASLMDSAGANDVCIKLIMGHSMKNDTTKGTYTHKTLEELLAEVSKI